MRFKILGPPGTGKTTFLLNKLQEEIENGIDPSRIAFLTFTRAARLEALKRTGKTENQFPYCKTIHSICYHRLGLGKGQIVTPELAAKFGIRIGIKVTGNDLDPWIEEFERGIETLTDGDILLQTHHKGRHRKQDLKESLKTTAPNIDYMYAKWFTEAYTNWKKATGYLDYTDLLTEFIAIGEPLDVDVIFIDEAQDLSPLQWDVVNKLGENAKKFYMAGDDDQAIFQWAGADASAFQKAHADQTIVLDQSHRCSKSVHDFALNIAGRIKERLKKDYKPTDIEGTVENIGYLNSVEFDGKTFILFRNHFRGNLIAGFLRNESIPFIGKGSPYGSVDMRGALIAYNYLIKKNEATAENIRRMLKFVDEDWISRGVHVALKEKTILNCEDVFLERPKLENVMNVLCGLRQVKGLSEQIKKFGIMGIANPKIEIMSIHQSKGREAETVVLDPEVSKAVWNGMLLNSDDEHRVWYTGATRAKNNLYIMTTSGAFNYRF